MDKVRFIRDGNVVYECRDGKWHVYDSFKSISAAKRWTNAREKEEKGCVRRYESLERELGPKKAKEMLR